ncbi:MAG: hypothetical protein SW833_24625 [Cyanobacteriota bacterium]|nr:hypothetical protein [Cyanobacteriota bacterium]
MTFVTLFPNAPDLSPEDYCVFGLATCFLRDEGEVKEVRVIEPIPSSALEAILKGIPTSYQLACAKSLGELDRDGALQIPPEFPPEAQFCDSFSDRAIAAARTYKSRPEAREHIPLGTTKTDLNYSLERKRVLNAESVVRAEDNVKQHSHTHKVL